MTSTRALHAPLSAVGAMITIMVTIIMITTAMITVVISTVATTMVILAI